MPGVSKNFGKHRWVFGVAMTLIALSVPRVIPTAPRARNVELERLLSSLNRPPADEEERLQRHQWEPLLEEINHEQAHTAKLHRQIEVKPPAANANGPPEGH